MAIPNLEVILVTPDERIYNNRPPGQKIGGLLLHHTGGRNSLGWLSTYHANPVSIHKLVPKRMPGGGPGYYQIVSDSKRAWHAGNTGTPDWGDISIGIEIENMGDGVDQYTNEQYETVAQIVASVTATYGFPDSMVKDHKNVAIPAGRKNDPRGWDHARMWARVKAIRQELIPPTESAIHRFWLANGATEVFGLPITTERKEWIGGQEYTVQYYERARLEWAPGRPVTRGLIGVELLKLRGEL